MKINYRDEAVVEHNEESLRVLYRKNQDYGNAIEDLLEVAVYLTSKVKRLKTLVLQNLLLEDGGPNFESLRDTLLDIRNYAEIGLLMHDDQWALPWDPEFEEEMDFTAACHQDCACSDCGPDQLPDGMTPLDILRSGVTPLKPPLFPSDHRCIVVPDDVEVVPYDRIKAALGTPREEVDA